MSLCPEWCIEQRPTDYVRRSPDYARARKSYSSGQDQYSSFAYDPVYDPTEDDEQVLSRAAADVHTEAHLVRIKEFKEYLTMCEELQSISPEVNNLAWTVWRRISATLDEALEVPDACPGANGEILLTWDRGPDHFEIEIEADSKVALFYLNSDKKLSWELDATPDGTIDRRTEPVLTEKILEVLHIFQIPNTSTEALTAGSAF